MKKEKLDITYTHSTGIYCGVVYLFDLGKTHTSLLEGLRGHDLCCGAFIYTRRGESDRECHDHCVYVILPIEGAVNLEVFARYGHFIQCISLCQTPLIQSFSLNTHMNLYHFTPSHPAVFCVCGAMTSSGLASASYMYTEKRSIKY